MTDRTYFDVLADLEKPLDRSRIKGVTVGGGGQAPYLATFDVIQTANRIFGYDNWSYRVVGEPQFISNPGLWYAVVEVKWGSVTRSDVGTNPVAGQSANSFEASIKGCVSDGLKRALRSFGAQFGNDLYDKDAEAAALRQERQQGSQGGAQRSEPSPPQPRAQTRADVGQAARDGLAPLEAGFADGERPLENVGQLFMWARTSKGLERDAVCKILGITLDGARAMIGPDFDFEAARMAIKVAVQAGGQDG